MAENTDQSPPTRADVESRWRFLVQHQSSRRELHEWAAEWVESRDIEIDDPMVRNALQHLHGFDLTRNSNDEDAVRHGAGEFYVHSDAEIEHALNRWLANCEEFDADPKEYIERAKRQAASRLE